MTCTYVHPPVDNVASEYWVEVPKELEDAAREIRTVKEGIAVYLQAFYQKFHSKEGGDTENGAFRCFSSI